MYGTSEAEDKELGQALKEALEATVALVRYVKGGRFRSNGITNLPKSVPRLVLDKVRQVLVSEVLNSNVLVQNVPNKSLSQELSTKSKG